MFSLSPPSLSRDRRWDEGSEGEEAMGPLLSEGIKRSFLQSEFSDHLITFFVIKSQMQILTQI